MLCRWLEIGYGASHGVSFEVAALRNPVTLAESVRVTCPNHEIGLSLGDGTEDTVTVASIW